MDAAVPPPPREPSVKPTADLCDAHAAELSVVEPRFADFGGSRRFAGEIATVQCFEDNSRVAERLAEPGRGRVLVVDGGGSLACALLGDNLAARAVENGWAGVLVNGCVRDAAVLAGMALGVRALAASPRRSVKRGAGEADVPVSFAGATFVPGHRLWADEDGIVVAARDLEAAGA